MTPISHPRLVAGLVAIVLSGLAPPAVEAERTTGTLDRDAWQVGYAWRWSKVLLVYGDSLAAVQRVDGRRVPPPSVTVRGLAIPSATHSDSTLVPWQAVRTVGVRDGTYAARGAVTGAFLAAGVLTLTMGFHCGDWACDGFFWAGALLAVPPAAVVGGLLGAAVPKWRTTYPEPPPRPAGPAHPTYHSGGAARAARCRRAPLLAPASTAELREAIRRVDGEVDASDGVVRGIRWRQQDWKAGGLWTYQRRGSHTVHCSGDSLVVMPEGSTSQPFRLAWAELNAIEIERAPDLVIPAAIGAVGGGILGLLVLDTTDSARLAIGTGTIATAVAILAARPAWRPLYCGNPR